MRRRLDLAMTLVGDPRIIFLDEPTTGLDPRSRRTMWDIIRDLVAGGVTVFLTTEYLDEADRWRIGSRCSTAEKIVTQGTPDELERLAGGGHPASSPTPRRLEPAAVALGATRRGQGPRPAGPQRRTPGRPARGAGPARGASSGRAASRSHTRTSTTCPRPHRQRDTKTHAIQDSATMLRRNLRRAALPVALRLDPASPSSPPAVRVRLRRNVGAGLAGGGREEYLEYVTAGILLLAVAGAAQADAISSRWT